MVWNGKNHQPGAFGMLHGWSPLRFHSEQRRLLNSRARFRVVPAGRRSGKTELAKRWVVSRAMSLNRTGAKYAFCAPTRQQAKNLYWRDLKKLVPNELVRSISETELVLELYNGNRLCVVGMDKPERIEGEPLDGCVLDEYANMKPTAWEENVSPALDTPGRLPGWCWFIGVPEGRNHYYDLWLKAKILKLKGESWDRFHWKSADIMRPEAVAAARDRMDPRSFRQEYEATFETFSGSVYYCWADAAAVSVHKWYSREAPIAFCFDFNRRPGTCVVVQEMRSREPIAPGFGLDFTAVIGEVYLEQSVTPEVVKALFDSPYGKHRGKVRLYGDASGGAETSSSVDGSDWDIITRMMRAHFKQGISFEVPDANPAVLGRTNAVNSRLLSSAGVRRCAVDPGHAPNLIRDFEGVVFEENSNKIDKKTNPKLTHASDAFGYYIAERFPVADGRLVIATVGG